MKALQRRTYSFDTRSVMLFTVLSLGGVGALQAQSQPPSPAPQATQAPAAPAAPSQATPYSYGPGTGKPSMAATNAFNRADSDKDGKLSEKEAAKLPAISQHFKELDTDKDGALSATEFEKGMHL